MSQKQTTYFDNAGNWGDAEGLLIFDTTEWIKDDFDTLDWATSSERRDVAKAINIYRQQHGAADLYTTEESSNE